jgi:hypothetical protein
MAFYWIIFLIVIKLGAIYRHLLPNIHCIDKYGFIENLNGGGQAKAMRKIGLHKIVQGSNFSSRIYGE